MILGWNASWFPNVVAYFSRKFGTKRADLISLFADALILHTGDTRTGVFFILFQFFFLLIFSKCLTRNEKRCVTCASKQLNNITFGFSETWLSPRSIWRCCVTTVLDKEKRIPNFWLVLKFYRPVIYICHRHLFLINLNFNSQYCMSTHAWNGRKTICK